MNYAYSIRVYVLALNRKIVDVLITIKKQNNQILAYIRKAPQTKGAVIFSLPENLPVSLPNTQMKI